MWAGQLESRFVRHGARTARALAALSAATLGLLALAPAAMASEGAGWLGPVTDKEITFFCFGVIAFFAILVTALSLVQGRLERRKEQRHRLQRF